MKINKLTLFSIILCFALIGKSMSTSDDKPSKKSSSKTAETPSSSPSDKSSDTDSPSDSPAQSPDSDSSGKSSSSSASLSDYIKEKYGDPSKAEYNPDLKKICGKTHHLDVCLATISPLIKKKKKFDASDVLEASIKVSKQSIKAVVDKVEKYGKESPKSAASLKECKENYSKALDNLQKASKAVDDKNNGKVTILLSGALADVSTAESKIVDLQLPKFKPEPFSLASVTTNNCVSIASLVPSN